MTCCNVSQQIFGRRTSAQMALTLAVVAVLDQFIALGLVQLNFPHALFKRQLGIRVSAPSEGLFRNSLGLAFP